MADVAQQLQQMGLYGSEPAGPQQHAAPPPPPPGLGHGLPPGAPLPGLRPAVPAMQQQQQQQQPPPLASLQGLRALMEGSVAEEAAQLAEAQHVAAESAAAVQAARQERRAAKKAAQKVCCEWGGQVCAVCGGQ